MAYENWGNNPVSIDGVPSSARIPKIGRAVPGQPQDHIFFLRGKAKTLDTQFLFFVYFLGLEERCYQWKPEETLPFHPNGMSFARPAPRWPTLRRLAGLHPGRRCNQREVRLAPGLRAPVFCRHPGTLRTNRPRPMGVCPGVRGRSNLVLFA